MLRALLAILVILELIAMGVYALQNQALETVRFLTMSWSGVPMWVVPAVAMAGMLVTCVLYGFFSGIGWRLRHHRLSRDVDEHHADVERLRRENAELHGRLRERDEAPVATEPTTEPAGRPATEPATEHRWERP
jgi:uncharacterized integral membrane protein